MAEAEELVGRLVSLTRPELHQAATRALELQELTRLEHWVARRLAGEPIQYITGRAAFRELDLAVTPDVLVPRPETEVLVEQVLRVLREVQEALDGHGIYCIASGLHLDPRFGKGAFCSPDDATRAEALRLTREAIDLAAEIEE